MLVIGLTGGIGSGKSTVANYFAHLGVTIIDADALAREVVEPDQAALKEITNYFGKQILDSSGRLNRGMLRQIVFADKDKKQWLETLLHPLIDTLMDQRIKECTSAYCILMSPLLIETAQIEKIDRLLVVDAPEELQLQRTISRDANTEATVKAIMASQSSRAARLQSADDILLNDRDLVSLEKNIVLLHQRYLVLAMEVGNAT